MSRSFLAARVYLYVYIRPYIVSWNGASADDRFEIDLHYCGSYSYCFEEVR